MYVIDTDVLSALRRPERAPQVAAWLKGKPEQDLYISVVTLGEIERGIVKQEGIDPVFASDLRHWLDRTMLLFEDRILAFEATDARIWGRLSVELGHAGADLMIAASALARGAMVLTGNRAHFEPTGVTLENPFATS